jgi:hypothetical protein
MRWRRVLLGALLIACGLTPDPVAADEQPVDFYVAVLYTLRQMPPDELIRIAWDGTGQTERALAIARRESGMNCAADNPRSSASGLFQHLSIHAPRAERMGLAWANVTGPDCLDDVLLAKAMWEESGWAPWRL